MISIGFQIIGRQNCHGIMSDPKCVIWPVMVHGKPVVIWIKMSANSHWHGSNMRKGICSCGLEEQRQESDLTHSSSVVSFPGLLHTSRFRAIRETIPNIVLRIETIHLPVDYTFHISPPGQTKWIIFYT